LKKKQFYGSVLKRKSSKNWSKDRNKKEITRYLKGIYKIGHIIEEEQIQRQQLRKVKMFEIYIKYDQNPKFYPHTIFKGNQNIFYQQKAEFSKSKYSIQGSLNNFEDSNNFSISDDI
jgi:hypothetical protein